MYQLDLRSIILMSKHTDGDDGTAITTAAAEMTSAEEATLALDLRIQLLETLVGLDTPLSRRPNAQEASIARRGQAVIAGVYDALDKSGTEAIKRFLDTCKRDFWHI